MNGYHGVVFTAEGRHLGHKPLGRRFVETIRSLGINGATLTPGVEGIGRDGRLHSARFFELADQPVEVTVAVNSGQCDQLFARLENEEANVFYVKTPVEFGVVGNPKS